MAKISAKKAGKVEGYKKHNKEIVANVENLPSAFTGLTMREALFCVAYVKNGGNASSALRDIDIKTKKYKNEQIHVYAYEIVRQPHVKRAISAYLSEIVTKDFVKGKFSQLAHSAKSEDTQLRATKELGRIVDVYGDKEGGSGGGISLTVSFNVPGIARASDSMIQDVEAREVDE